MTGPIKRVVILGGGTAGWLTAGILAADHCSSEPDGLEVILVEAPDVPPIGVGEGTWPSMRNTLRRIGISETELFRECEASFKQGAKFCGWVTGNENDFYYHPLVVPEGYGEFDIASSWLDEGGDESFADAINFQSHLCEMGIAPKQITTPEYAGIANYAYHLNAGKLGQLLTRHCIDKLGVQHVLARVTSVKSTENGDIAALLLDNGGEVAGDLFVDCSGFASRLLGEHFQVPFIDCRDQLFNDRAIAVQVPYATEEAAIASHTISTAQEAGWIWDIGLPTRRGMGHVYSSAHMSDDRAQDLLEAHLKKDLSDSAVADLQFRQIQMRPGHREHFWHKNCVAVGMSAGFLEPLEASALVLVELSAGLISDDLPASRAVMDTVAKRFNERFRYRWASIIDFLKLHYVLTKRTDSEYWRDNCLPQSQSSRLQEWLALWRVQPPCRHDFPQVEEVFASASWQYVLYGMGFRTLLRPTKRRFEDISKYRELHAQNKRFVQRCRQALPENRELIQKIIRHGLSAV